MRRLDLEATGGLFWLAVGIFFGLGAIKLGLGTLRNPGTGFFPGIMATFLVFFSVLVLVKGLIRPERGIGQILWVRPILMTGCVFFYGFLLNLIGFLLSTFAMMFILFGLLRGKDRWHRVLIYSVTTALAAWLIFCVALKVPFPSPRLLAIWR